MLITWHIFPVSLIFPNSDRTPLCFHRPTHPTETTLGVLCYFSSKESLLFANNKSISYKIESYINHSNCQNWCCLLTSADEVSRARERDRLFTICNNNQEILVENFRSVRTIRVVYHLPKSYKLSICRGIPKTRRTRRKKVKRCVFTNRQNGEEKKISTRVRSQEKITDSHFWIF